MNYTLPKWVSFVLVLIITGLLMVMIIQPQSSQKESQAKVISLDNSSIVGIGINKLGHQLVKVRILDGPYENKIIEGINHLSGNWEFDQLYEKNDLVLVAIEKPSKNVLKVKLLSHYRLGWIALLFGFFALSLIIYAKFTGVKALMSFIGCIYLIFQFLLPQFLAGSSPLTITSIFLVIASALIIFSVAGFTKKGTAAFLGTALGLASMIILTIVVGSVMKLSGLTTPFSQSLLMSGYTDLNMRHIFYGTILIGASGAVMDIAMDIASAIEEIKINAPNITKSKLISSGFNVGHAVIGTMTTTLLLAYLGGFLTLLLLFQVRNTSLLQMLNMKIVASEIMRTIIGSVGLVLVAPITSIIAGFLFTKDQEKGERQS